MNKDQVKGTAKDIAGKVQEAAGRAMDDSEMQARGLHKQVVGKAQKAMGAAKKGAKQLRDAAQRASTMAQVDRQAEPGNSHGMKGGR